ncbi:MAG: 1,4-dihydroxy-2-naphthoyl-CoA synthase [Alphaproteobacteria bacterium]|jgi:2-ketocyclohexanecarboxyl-CoA hydrolase|nr:1,4-dihydroxy-2-naphthoyl-CoA synthase [Alphaproteobacteria bacterium]
MTTDYQDILYEERHFETGEVATITINRPERMNAFRAQTCEEIIHAFNRAGWNRDIGVIVLTGAGTRAFCTGGDQSAHDGQYDGRGVIGLPLEEMQTIIREVPKPVIAKVRGYAIGGGHVLALICDLTLAAESAVFGQVGPKVGSVDPGFGTAYMARCIGEKKAREVWYLCRRYSAQQAVEMGLANRAVPDDRLDDEVDQWCAEILAMSPTALAIAKRSFNADSANIAGIAGMGLHQVRMFYQTEESREGVKAFQEKRKPAFRKYYK